MRLGAERWFLLCEQLGARGGFTYNCPLPPLSFRPKPSTPLLSDVVMADTPAGSAPLAGSKRPREDEAEEEYDGWDLEVRAEKVSAASKAALNVIVASAGC